MSNKCLLFSNSDIFQSGPSSLIFYSSAWLTSLYEGAVINGIIGCRNCPTMNGYNPTFVVYGLLFTVYGLLFKVMIYHYPLIIPIHWVSYRLSHLQNMSAFGYSYFIISTGVFSGSCSFYFF